MNDSGTPVRGFTFPLQVSAVVALIGGLGAYPVAVYGGKEILIAAVIGASMATVNVLLGYAAIEHAFDKSTTTFFKYVLGGMGIRLLVMAGILVLCITVFRLHVGSLVGSLGLFYAIYLTLEVLYIQKKVSEKQQM